MKIIHLILIILFGIVNFSDAFEKWDMAIGLGYMAPLSHRSFSKPDNSNPYIVDYLYTQDIAVKGTVSIGGSFMRKFGKIFSCGIEGAFFPGIVVEQQFKLKDMDGDGVEETINEKTTFSAGQAGLAFSLKKKIGITALF